MTRYQAMFILTHHIYHHRVARLSFVTVLTFQHDAVGWMLCDFSDAGQFLRIFEEFR